MVWGMAEGPGGCRLQSSSALHVHFTERRSYTGTPSSGYTASYSERWVSQFVFSAEIFDRSGNIVRPQRLVRGGIGTHSLDHPE